MGGEEEWEVRQEVASWMGMGLHLQLSLLPNRYIHRQPPVPTPILEHSSSTQILPIPYLSFQASLPLSLFLCLSIQASLPLPLFPCLSFSASLPPVHQRSEAKRFDVIAKEAQRQSILLIRAKERLRNESMLGAGCFCD